MPLESLKEKGQNSTKIVKLEEMSLRAEDAHVLTTEGSLAEGSRPQKRRPSRGSASE